MNGRPVVTVLGNTFIIICTILIFLFSKEYMETKKQHSKVKKVMKEFKEDKLHSGSKKGPLVKKPKQALAIAMSEAKIKPKKKK